MAQASAGRLHFVDTQQVKRGPQDAYTAPNDGAAIVLHARQAQTVCLLGFEQFVEQPVQPGLRHSPFGPAGSGQHVIYSANGAG